MIGDNFIQPDQILPENKEIDILDLTAEPYADNRRIKVNFRLSSFYTPPHASLKICNEKQEELVIVNIVNIFNPENEITLHLPAHQNQPGKYTISMDIFFILEDEPDTGDNNPISLKQSKPKTFSTSFIIQ